MKNDERQAASGEGLRGLLAGFVMVGQVAVARRKFLVVMKGKLSRWLFVLALLAGCLLPLAAGRSLEHVDQLEGDARRGFDRSLARVQPLLDRYGYGAAFAAVVVEGMGIPTPGQTLLIASALEAAAGRMNIALLLLLVTLAATAGNSIGYAAGRWGGRMALDRLRVNPQRQQALDDLITRRGGWVILFARFVDGLRQLNGIVAGAMGMPWWNFTAYNVAGAVLWACGWGLGSYYLGRDIHGIAAFWHRHALVLYLLSAAFIVGLLVFLLRLRKPN